MTYRQIFDEAIGAGPPSAVDVDALVAREGRRRRRRVGTYTASATTGVLALTLGAGILVGPRSAGDPAPASSAASATAVDHAQRLRAAMLAALDREVPELQWVRGAEPVTDRRTWGGPVTGTPQWSVQSFRWVSMTGWFGVGVAARGDVRSYLAVNVGRLRPGQTAGPDGCTPHMLNCRAFAGPNGEQVVAHDVEALARLSAPPSERKAIRYVTVRRTDGTRVTVETHSSTGDHLMTVEEMTGVALDPAIRLD
ncbi:hypothetical protein [Micromonospora maritima]|uniref:hypothetical protein n=1 Tax=Micromonospora maritima TaxID=986711 RepID=UPI00157BD089|nr:hypothetical protein [Micromonospora maritima]